MRNLPADGRRIRGEQRTGAGVVAEWTGRAQANGYGSLSAREAEVGALRIGILTDHLSRPRRRRKGARLVSWEGGKKEKGVR